MLYYTIRVEMVLNVNYHLLFFTVVGRCCCSQRHINKFVIFQHTGQSHAMVEELEILKPQSIELLCNLTGVPSKPSNITGFWRKDGVEMENSHETVYRHSEQYILKKMYVEIGLISSL